MFLKAKECWRYHTTVFRKITCGKVVLLNSLFHHFTDIKKTVYGHFWLWVQIWYGRFRADFAYIPTWMTTKVQDRHQCHCRGIPSHFHVNPCPAANFWLNLNLYLNLFIDISLNIWRQNDRHMIFDNFFIESSSEMILCVSPKWLICAPSLNF